MWLNLSEWFLIQVSLIILFIFSTEINIYDMSEDDRFMVIASDGVWEFMSNEYVASIVTPFFQQGHAEQAANSIVREAALQWK